MIASARSFPASTPSTSGTTAFGRGPSLDDPGMHVERFHDRIEIVGRALSQGVPLCQVEEQFDWLDSQPR